MHLEYTIVNLLNSASADNSMFDNLNIETNYLCYHIPDMAWYCPLIYISNMIYYGLFISHSDSHNV